MAVLGELAAAGDRFADLDALERALAGGGVVPDAVLVAGGAAVAGDRGQAARAAATAVLGLVQRWLASEWLGGARLVVVTRGGVAVGEQAPDLVQAPVWGLVRSAQSEHPGRFLLVDADGGAEPDWAALVAAGEPQLAVREGRLLAPRLRRAPAAPAGDMWRLSTTRKPPLTIPKKTERRIDARESKRWRGDVRHARRGDPRTVISS